MALTTLDKKPVDTARTPWPPEITAEFERERKSPNGCVGQKLVSENERAVVPADAIARAGAALERRLAGAALGPRFRSWRA